MISFAFLCRSLSSALFSRANLLCARAVLTLMLQGLARVGMEGSEILTEGTSRDESRGGRGRRRERGREGTRGEGERKREQEHEGRA